MEFQPQTLTTPDLGSITYCYVAYLLDPPRPLLLPPDAPPPPQSSFICLCHHHQRIIRPSRRLPSLSQHTKNPFPSLISPITARVWLLISSLCPDTTVGLPYPPISHCCRNIFQHGLQLLLLSHPPRQWLSQLPPFLLLIYNRNGVFYNYGVDRSWELNLHLIPWLLQNISQIWQDITDWNLGEEWW